MRQIKMENLKGKTFVKVENHCINVVYFLTDKGVRYMIDTELMGLGIYGPTLYRISDKEYADMNKPGS